MMIVTTDHFTTTEEVDAHLAEFCANADHPVTDSELSQEFERFVSTPELGHVTLT
jgi:hypothetical protein